MIFFLDNQTDEQAFAGLVANGSVRLVAFGARTVALGDDAVFAGLQPALPAGLGLAAAEHPDIHSLVRQFVEERSSRTRGNTVAFQGARGAYSEQAILQFFAEPEVLPCAQFKDAFEAVRTGAARFAMLPIENALTGSIHDNYDLLLAYPDLAICGETRLRIRHHLFGYEGAGIGDIKRVFSHPQGLLQCAAFLSQHPDWQQIPYYDTAGSVEHLRELGSKENAAIAGAAAKLYGMPVLAEGIETNHENYTRFVVLARREDPEFPLDLDSRTFKASIVFSLPHQPGALLKAMMTMGNRDLNLSKIESRPIHGKPWEYMFYLDLEIGTDVEGFLLALEELRRVGEQVRVLGVYPRAR